jgi:hypothetical protein
VEGARFAVKVEVKAEIGGGTGAERAEAGGAGAEVKEGIGLIWKELKAEVEAEGAGRAGADGTFIGKEIKPEAELLNELKAGAGVAGAEIEVEDEAWPDGKII